jgi:glucokinase
MQTIILAADLGGTNLRMAAVADDGRILHRVRRATPDTDGDAVICAIVESARECIAEVGEQPESLGIAVPATINMADGILRNAPNLPFLSGTNLADPIASILGIPVITDNDATLAGLGENWLGASRGFRDAICITLGTGVGGGLILNGEVYRGIDGTAGEIGHICVEPDGVPCGCGSRGCLEQYASATAVVRIARELLLAGPKSGLASVGSFTSLDLFEAGRANDVIAVEAFRKSGHYLGIALGGLVNVLNPEIIVIGGGMSAAWELIIGSVAAEMKKRAFREPAERVKLIPAKLGDDAGILGAARLAHLSHKQASSSIV